MKAMDNEPSIIGAITPPPREGWEVASRASAEAGDEALVWPEFGNADDETWTW